MVAGDKGNEDTGEAVARNQSGVGLAVHGGNFHAAGETGGAAAEQTREKDQAADRQAGGLGGANVAPHHAGRETESRVVDQHIGDQAKDDAESQSPMDVQARQVANHHLRGDPISGWLIETGGIAQRALNEEIKHSDRDVGHEQAGDGLVDAAAVTQSSDERDNQAARQHRSNEHAQSDRRHRCALEQ